MRLTENQDPREETKLQRGKSRRVEAISVTRVRLSQVRHQIIDALVVLELFLSVDK
jgi:hypothetical protein